MSESLKILIEAEDLASSKIKSVSDEWSTTIDDMTRKNSDWETSTKAVTNAEKDQITVWGEKGFELKKVNRVLDDHLTKAESLIQKYGALAGKVAAVVGVVTTAYAIGKTINDWYRQTEKWNNELDRAISKSKALNKQQADAARKKFKQELELAQLRGEGVGRLAPTDKERDAKSKAVKRLAIIENSGALDENSGLLEGDKANLKVEADQLRTTIALYNEKKEKIDDLIGRHAQDMEAERKKQAFIKLGLNIQQQIQDKQNEFAIRRFQVIQDEKAAKIKADNDAAENRIKQAAAAAKAVADEEERKEKFVKRTVEGLMEQVIAQKDGAAAAESYKMQVQGVDKAKADEFARIQEEINKITGERKPVAKTTGGQGDNAAMSSRFLTGRGSTNPQVKIAANTKKQLDLTAAQTKALENLEKQLEKLLEKPPMVIEFPTTIGLL